MKGSIQTSNTSIAEAWIRSDERFYAKQNDWIQQMKSLGAVCAHPDDGWVDRQRNTICPSYPYFWNTPKVGDLCALGRPSEWRLVRIIWIEPKEGQLSKYIHYGFEQRIEDNPQLIEAPKISWIHRLLNNLTK